MLIRVLISTAVVGDMHGVSTRFIAALQRRFRWRRMTRLTTFYQFDLGATLKRALGGGLSGAAAMVLQVLSLMPLRTIMNYQYRYGTTMKQATKTLYADGGWTRYYQGLTAALIQGPVSRFGDTAANVGILALLKGNKYMRNLPALAQTIFASLAAAAFRMILTPIDTVKTTMQTDGKAGLAILRSRVRVLLRPQFRIC